MIKWDNLVMLPIAGYVMWPAAVLVPGGLLLLAYFFNRKVFILFTAIAWGLYGIYEALMKARILCTGECNIRVDLLLIIPLLYILSIVSAVKFFRKKVPHGPA